MSGFRHEDEVDVQRLRHEWMDHQAARLGRQLRADMENRAAGVASHDEGPDWSVLKCAAVIVLGIGCLVLAYLALSIVLMVLGVIAFGAAFMFGWRLIAPLTIGVFMLPMIGAGLVGAGQAVVGLFWAKLVLGLTFGVAAFGVVLLPVIGPIWAYQYATDTHFFIPRERTDWWRYEVKREQGIIRVFVTNMHASRPMSLTSLGLTCDYHGGPNGMRAGFIFNRNDSRHLGPGLTRQLYFGDLGYRGWEHRINAASCRVW
jgi:hypothetical protein